MPDAHFGIGATVGSVIPTIKALIPAAVGVDLGCGMCAKKTSLNASSLPDSLRNVRLKVEEMIPHGFSSGKRDVGSYSADKVPQLTMDLWKNELEQGYKRILAKHPKIRSNRASHLQLGTLGSGNHFIEMCLDQNQDVWLMLHSGSRGVGNRIGSYFIEKAKEEMGKLHGLPDANLSYFREGSQYFNDYVEAVTWAQNFAKFNRVVMMDRFVEALRLSPEMPPFSIESETAVNCHHNYISLENHYGVDSYVTRKGAISARQGEFGIIPGSMGAKSFIVRGKGNPESYHSCSHGAGRVMSRNEAKRRFTVDDHKKAVQGVECRTDKGILDETPAAYKPIDEVMRSQEDLVEIVYTLKQVMCVK